MRRPWRAVDGSGGGAVTRRQRIATVVGGIAAALSAATAAAYALLECWEAGVTVACVRGALGL